MRTRSAAGGAVFRCAAPLAIASLVLQGCGSAVVDAAYVEAGAAPQPDNSLGPGDIVDIRVYEEKELSNTYQVASNGTVDYPLVGAISVAGKTPAEAAELIEKELREGLFLKNPQVSILVRESISKKVSIFGQVNKPGTFPYRDGMTVVEAISLAGGFNSMAKMSDTTVTRIVDDKKKLFLVPVDAIGEGRAPNFLVRAGDIIWVPERIF